MADIAALLHLIRKLHSTREVQHRNALDAASCGEAHDHIDTIAP